MTTRSEPPPSIPPPPPVSQRATSSDPHAGWRPADDDSSPEATDWRSRTALRRSDRALDALGDLKSSVNTLSATMQAWSAKSERHWQTVTRLAWAVGVPILIAIVLGLGAIAWNWISTLHH